MEPDKQTEPLYITLFWSAILRFPNVANWSAKKLGSTFGSIQGLTEFYRTGTERQREISRFLIAGSLLAFFCVVCVIGVLL